jgi:hypothetical protein
LKAVNRGYVHRTKGLWRAARSGLFLVPAKEAQAARRAACYDYLRSGFVSTTCRYCKRRGRYRKETLVATYGPEATFEQLLTWLSADCALSSNRTNRAGCRGAYLIDLEKKR